ncbi:hypothetical protein [Actinokineospora sp. HUAS TT18]|uniref:hypothetical protein n=1 Tax=Actinokineospora sp. HUAS TT18 TaxID=3447451 RepID=UPI003F524BEB
MTEGARPSALCVLLSWYSGKTAFGQVLSFAVTVWGVFGMALGSRRTGIASLVAGLGAAAALAGVAVLTVNNAACADPGRYVSHGTEIELVGGCVNPADLPAAPAEDTPTRSGGVVDPLRQAP